MPTATLTSKGQITLPIAVRTALGLHTGEKLDFVALDDGFKLVPLRSDAATLRGRFAGRVTRAVSVAQMDAAIADEAVQRYRRSTKSAAKSPRKTAAR